MHTLDAVNTLAQQTGENVPPWLTVLVMVGLPGDGGRAAAAQGGVSAAATGRGV